MIAIAGAKGGCGKTTTTLGLARAFDRAGRLSFVIDADQQLPNLHVAADIDREPTVATVEENNDAAAIAQPLPGATKAGVLPAPLDSEMVDLADLLDRFSTSAGEALVDCPAGAGPDVAGPIDAADRVVVVTTGTERSLTSAGKTIDLAKRQGTPVAGVVLNQSEQLPIGFRARFDVPLLGRVPPFQSAERDRQAREAYDHIAAELLSNRNRPSAPARRHPDIRLPTGLAPVDRELQGGIPAGSVVALSAEQGSRSELLLHAITRERGTLYLPVGRSREDVRQALKTSLVQTGDPTVRELDERALLTRGSELLGRLPHQINVVIDPMDRLEQQDREAYYEFLQMVSDAVRATDSVALLHTLDRTPTPRNRVTTERFADLILRCETTEHGARQTYQISVSKESGDGLIDQAEWVDVTEQFTRRPRSAPEAVLKESD
ncbi:DUF7125 family protein [Haloarcula rara]|uniref:DUF7125 family protein n=1 Tax=Haloarcula rara TaxID=3033387 RepID=UPI0023E8A481|nr:P-loop NTPase [Halomicroarcula sp. SHR3]